MMKLKLIHGVQGKSHQLSNAGQAEVIALCFKQQAINCPVLARFR